MHTSWWDSLTLKLRQGLSHAASLIFLLSEFAQNKTQQLLSWSSDPAPVCEYQWDLINFTFITDRPWHLGETRTANPNRYTAVIPQPHTLSFINTLTSGRTGPPGKASSLKHHKNVKHTHAYRSYHPCEDLQFSKDFPFSCRKWILCIHLKLTLALKHFGCLIIIILLDKSCSSCKTNKQTVFLMGNCLISSKLLNITIPTLKY